MLVRQHQRQDLCRDRADLHRPVGHRRDRLVGAIELQCRFADLVGDRRSHARFDHFPHQIAGTFVGHEAGGRHFDARCSDARDALGDVTDPGTAGHVVVKACVAVDEDVDAGTVLGGHVAREAVEVLLAIGETGKSLRQGNAAQVFGVPAWAGQRPRGGREKSLAFCYGKHAYFP